MFNSRFSELRKKIPCVYAGASMHVEKPTAKQGTKKKARQKNPISQPTCSLHQNTTAAATTTYRCRPVVEGPDQLSAARTKYFGRGPKSNDDALQMVCRPLMFIVRKIQNHARGVGFFGRRLAYCSAVDAYTPLQRTIDRHQHNNPPNMHTLIVGSVAVSTKQRKLLAVAT